MTSHRSLLLPTVAALAIALSACGSDDSAVALTPAGEAGRDVTIENGCASCHGTNGEGNVGPAFVGLFGSTVELDDGTTVVADEAYIIESIKDPGAKRVEGYNLPMPQTNLSDDEIASVVDYIRELATPATDATEAP
jgi:cytochrome c553